MWVEYHVWIIQSTSILLTVLPVIGVRGCIKGYKRSELSDAEVRVRVCKDLLRQKFVPVTLRVIRNNAVSTLYNSVVKWHLNSIEMTFKYLSSSRVGI